MKRAASILSLLGFVWAFLPGYTGYGYEPRGGAEPDSFRDSSSEDPWDPRHTRQLRNPFLPPGYRSAEEVPTERLPDTPAAARPRPSDAQWDAARDTLSIRGVSQIGGRVAVLIGTRIVSEGAIIETIYNGLRYRWRVAELDMQTGVQLQRISATDPDTPVSPDENTP